MKKTTSLLTVFCALFAFAAEASTSEKLATFQVGPNSKAYSFNVKNCATNISAVKLRVGGDGIFLANVGVVYSDNSTKQMNVNFSFRGGSETPWVNFDQLSGNDPRCPVKVFATANSKGTTAVVETWAAVN